MRKVFVLIFLISSSIFGQDSLIVFRDPITSVDFSFIGDLMCHSTQFKYAQVTPDSFDFKPVYREIKKYLAEPDFMIANYETVNAGEDVGYIGYPVFNTPDSFAEAIKEAGIDIVSTANNHCFDQREKGILKTLDLLNTLDIEAVGTYKSAADRDSIRIFEKKGISFALLTYTSFTNIPNRTYGKEYLLNYSDTLLIKRDIEKAKSLDPDLVILFLHFGQEYKREPNDYQKRIVNKAREYGADIIIGSHPHVIQPIDYFPTNNGRIDTGFVAYSLGNFISNQRWRYSDTGVILNFTVKKDTVANKVSVHDLNYLPAWVFKGRTARGDEYIILPSELALSDTSGTLFPYLGEKDREMMKEAFEDTKEIMEKYSDKPRLRKITK